MITLTKEDGPADLDGVTHLEIGASWDPTVGSSGGIIGKLRQKAGTDLDLIAIAMQGRTRYGSRGSTPRTRWATARWCTAGTTRPARARATTRR
jgi:hypothetical protein